jgi:hypothetical protein
MTPRCLDERYAVRVTSAGVVFKPVSARSCFGLYAVMAVMVTSSSVGFWFVILVRRLLARMSRPR